MALVGQSKWEENNDANEQTQVSKNLSPRVKKWLNHWILDPARMTYWRLFTKISFRLIEIRALIMKEMR